MSCETTRGGLVCVESKAVRGEGGRQNNWREDAWKFSKVARPNKPSDLRRSVKPKHKKHEETHTDNNQIV